MKAIVMNTTGSLLNKRMEAITLKTSFLLCDEVYAAGNTGFELSIRETHSKYSVERKLDLLGRWCADDERIPEMVQEIREVIKQAKKKKHKTTEDILFLKSMEKGASDMLNRKIDEIEETLTEAGFEVLKELKKEHKFQSYCFGDDPEKPLAGVMASSLLQRLLPSVKENEEPEIFFLGADFFQEDNDQAVHFEYTSPGASDAQNMVLHCCFTVPNINALSTAEMETVRSQLLPVRATFTHSLNEWIDMCYFDDSIADRNCFFKDEILPLAAHVQEAIEKNEILKLCSRMQNDDVKLNIWFGEMPVWKLWKYYKKYNVIGAATWQKLEALKETNAYRNQRWPVAVLSVPGEKYTDTKDGDEVAAETDIQQTKKYLIID